MLINMEKNMNQITRDVAILREEILPKIFSAGNPCKVILFGSRARHQSGSGCDVDILLIESSTLPRYRRAARYRRALKDLRLPKDILVWTPEEIAEWQNVPNAFINVILREGVTLYEKQD